MFDYTAKVKEAWQSNFENKKLSEERIKSYCEKTGYESSIVRTKINTDEMFRWWFVVDPVRQNVFEKIAAKHIESIVGVTSFEKYGTNEWFIVAGALKHKRELNGMKPEFKSIDFGWKYGKKKFYASHKYTHESGGAQDNQYKDIQRFVTAANEIGGKDIFVAIVDGEYYETTDSKAGMTRRQRLEQRANNKNVFVTDLEKLEEFLCDFG